MVLGSDAAAIVASGYATDSLVEVSLLGNWRFTIREFIKRYSAVDEAHWVSLFAKARYPKLYSATEVPRLDDLLAKFQDTLKQAPEKIQDWLRPGSWLLEKPINQVAPSLPHAVQLLNNSKFGFAYDYYNPPAGINELLSDVLKLTDSNSHAFDLLFTWDVFLLWARDRTSSERSDGPDLKDLFPIVEKALEGSGVQVMLASRRSFRTSRKITTFV